MIKLLKNEDCLKTLADLPDNHIDLILTSPPYDGIRNFNGNFKFDFDKLASLMLDKLKPGGALVWVVNDQAKNENKTLTSFRQAIKFQELGFNFVDNIIYEKTPRAVGNARLYWPAYEYNFVLGKGRLKTVNVLKDRKNQIEHTRNKKKQNRDQDGNIKQGKKFTYGLYGRRSNIWYYPTGLYGTTKDKVAFEHPAIISEFLAIDHILSWTNEKDLVFDPFTGSGTTWKACIKTNRAFLGSEIDSEYYEIALKRVKPYLNQEILC